MQARARVTPAILVVAALSLLVRTRSIGASVALVGDNFESHRLGVDPIAASGSSPAETSARTPELEPHSGLVNLSSEPLVAHESKALERASANGQPPIYMSAPKQVNELNQVRRAGESTGDVRLDSLASLGLGKRKSASDLHAAAGKHYKPKKKKKIIVVKKKKKKPKKKKIIIVKKKKPKRKKKKKKVIVVYKKKHHKAASHQPRVIKYQPQPSRHAHSHHEHQHQHEAEPTHSYGAGGGHHDHGEYYEHRSVPKKGSWEFGYKRGNEKHLIERKEHGHKSHFKTEVKWRDKKGKGQHVFDYNHGDKKHHGYYAAAASSGAAVARTGAPDQRQQVEVPAASPSGESMRTGTRPEIDPAPAGVSAA